MRAGISDSSIPFRNAQVTQYGNVEEQLLHGSDPFLTVRRQLEATTVGVLLGGLEVPKK